MPLTDGVNLKEGGRGHGGASRIGRRGRGGRGCADGRLDGARVAERAAWGEPRGAGHGNSTRRAIAEAGSLVARGDRRRPGGRARGLEGRAVGSRRISRTSRPMMPSSWAMRRRSPAASPTWSSRYWCTTTTTSSAGRSWSGSIAGRARLPWIRCGRTGEQAKLNVDRMVKSLETARAELGPGPGPGPVVGGRAGGGLAGRRGAAGAGAVADRRPAVPGRLAPRVVRRAVLAQKDHRARQEPGEDPDGHAARSSTRSSRRSRAHREKYKVAEQSRPAGPRPAGSGPGLSAPRADPRGPRAHRHGGPPRRGRGAAGPGEPGPRLRPPRPSSPRPCTRPCAD